MFELNVGLIIATGIVGALTYFVKEGSDHNWHIKYPKTMQIGRRLLIPSYFVLFVLSVGTTIKENNNSATERDTLRSDLNSLKETLSEAERNAESTLGELQDVKQYAKRTDSLISPFISLAARRYKNLDTTMALQKLYRDITINIKTETINAPNAQIATIGQTGNNFVISTIPDVQVTGKWISFNKLVDSVSTTPNSKKKEQLPTKRFPYQRLYTHQFEVTYASPIMRNRATFVLDNESIFDVDIKHKGTTKSGKGRIPNPGKYQGYFYVALSQPEDGQYILTFYSTEKLTNTPMIEVIN